MSGLDSRPSLSEQKRIREGQREQEDNMDVEDNRSDALEILLDHYQEISRISAEEGAYRDLSATSEVIAEVNDLYPLTYVENPDSTGSLVAQATDFLYEQVIPRIRKNGGCNVWPDSSYDIENEQFYDILSELSDAQDGVGRESTTLFGYTEEVKSEIRVQGNRVFVGLIVDGLEEEWQLTEEFLEKEGEPRSFYKWMLRKAREADRINE